MKVEMKNKDKFCRWKVCFEDSVACEVNAIDKITVDGENVKFFRSRSWGEEVVFQWPLDSVKSMERI